MEQTNTLLKNTLLKIDNLSVYYGPICAIKKIDLEVKQGEIVAVLGANGAGKSTMVNTIIGLMKAKTGTVVFDGKELTKMRTDQIIQSGISVVPEGRGMLADMTVMENLQLGVYHHKVDFNKNLEMVVLCNFNQVLLVCELSKDGNFIDASLCSNPFCCGL